MTVVTAVVCITVTVGIHAVVVFWHAWAHMTLAVNMSWLQNAFIVSVIMATPVVAGVLVWAPYRRTGALALTASMFGALIFGVYHHFLDPGVDNISRVPTGGWGMLLRLTAILLAILEGWGASWVGGVFAPSRGLGEAWRSFNVSENTIGGWWPFFTAG